MGWTRSRRCFDSGDFRADLIAQLQYHPAADRQALREKMTPHMIAYASRNRAMGAMWRARVVEPARLALTNMIKRGEKRGDPPPRPRSRDRHRAAARPHDLSPRVRQQVRRQGLPRTSRFTSPTRFLQPSEQNGERRLVGRSVSGRAGEVSPVGRLNLAQQ